MTVAEIRRGVLEKPPGKRRDQLEAWFGGAEGPQALFAGRVTDNEKDFEGVEIVNPLRGEGR
jgi:hypothetical protein